MNTLKHLLTVSTLVISVSAMAADNYEPPRTASGKPNLQGYWTNASLTKMQRGSGYAGLTIPADQVAKYTRENPANVRQATDDGLVAGELLDGKDLGRGRGYNAFWVDPGTDYGVVKGEVRTSWIVSPDNGRIPFSDQGQQLRREHRAKFSSNDGPEGRSLGERCLIGFGSTGGPPMNNILYNNTYQIVQTDDYVMILVEMVHDARIIPINGDHRPDALSPWLGDSIGWWEGDTLVVETVNLHPQQAPTNVAALSSQGKIIERFTRDSDEQIFYEFEVIDPVYYTSTWSGEMAMNVSDGQLYEYACHEGNYGLPGILGGARREDMDALNK
ncbi:MAG: hypothetical protein COC19_04095 [SAR86 cluster bacterium]|uniref:Uncharacterized protein n=1 Tax=SAR86 cluster bacterium TaxID=2030880 RepID=A0A2A4MPY9_9GAMM|nr:MAG: hypothetical protein COC19_04095 [SAR86 cluster bacterium]